MKNNVESQSSICLIKRNGVLDCSTGIRMRVFTRTKARTTHCVGDGVLLLIQEHRLHADAFKDLPSVSLANNESICSITRDLRVSRHELLSIRNQYVQEMQAARERIKAAIEALYLELEHKAMEKIGRLIQVERSPLRLIKIATCSATGCRRLKRLFKRKTHILSR